MPQAHPDLVEKMRQWAKGLSTLHEDGAAITLYGLDDVARLILKKHGYRFANGGAIRGPAPMEPAVADSIDYLCDEWDYAFEQDKETAR